VRSGNTGPRPRLLWAALLLALAAAALQAPAALAAGREAPWLALVVYPDGYVYVETYYTPQEAPGSLEVPLLGAPIYYGAEQSGLVLPVEEAGGALNVTYYTQDDVHVYYLTANLTVKSGQYWRLEYTSPTQTLVVLPEGAVPISVEPTTVTPTLYNGSPALLLPPGHVSVEYVIVPQTPPQGATPPGSAPGGGGAETQGQTTQGGGGTTAWLAPLTLAAAAAAGAAWYLAAHRGRGGGGGAAVEAVASRLDERDEAILAFLRDHGPATAQEIMEATRIPRTPLYRRLRKLEEMGLVEHIDEPGGPRRYRVR